MDWYDKYIVIKTSDVDKYLDNTLKHYLGLILDTIQEKRHYNGETNNTYMVVNREEDYAHLVEEIVEMGENMKSKKEIINE